LIPTQENGQVFVEDIHLAQGEAFPEVSNPMFFKKRKKDQTWYHPQLDPDRMVWRDSASLFSFNDQIDERPKAFRQVQTMRGVVPLSDRYVCAAYALANSQANPLAWRKERLSVPIALLSDPDVVAYLEKGMSLADNGAYALNNAIKTFLREYLPDKSKDVVKLANASGTAKFYWDKMEAHFQKFLLALTDPDAAIETWEGAIKQLTRNALDECIQGRYRASPRTYKARTAASAELNRRLAGLHE
jgi:CRISPR system Cascade subunit CasA